ncbi:hypothetical protein EJ02DRAFT_88460 [Clathrospora elynae]|uniref:Uncharacterized protein n=1 Tax=Clathrospora elynae TaxID=706981 RepID=A0A6A5SAM3_9PLEO|nr:hypothetical protein EJ02DRAFT_81051 [Clathrospora elynae]KAF1947367.1 hypothetical protein EJ02DRAFT_88460 [Clathrospora elynae]
MTTCSSQGFKEPLSRSTEEERSHYSQQEATRVYTERKARQKQRRKQMKRGMKHTPKFGKGFQVAEATTLQVTKRTRSSSNTVESQLSSQPQRPTQSAEKANDNEKYDVTYIKTMSKGRSGLGVIAVPTQGLHSIGLTLNDPDEAVRTQQPRKMARHDQDDEGAESDLRYAFFRKQPEHVKETVQFPLTKKLLLEAGEKEEFKCTVPARPEMKLSRKQKHEKRLARTQEEHKQRCEQKKTATVGHPDIMFTVAEAIAVLARSGPTFKPIPYDIQTGEHLSYPIKRSYHLGAMGRYGVT